MSAAPMSKKNSAAARAASASEASGAGTLPIMSIGRCTFLTRRETVDLPAISVLFVSFCSN
jgi:hypothetical protein